MDEFEELLAENQGALERFVKFKINDRHNAEEHYSGRMPKCAPELRRTQKQGLL